MSRHAGGVDCGPRCVHVGFFLELADVFLVSDSLVAKPVRYLSAQAENLQISETNAPFNQLKVSFVIIHIYEDADNVCFSRTVY